jgi:hypothetical protein
MLCYQNKNYGADADGNRGYSQWEYDIEPCDYEYVLDNLKTLMDEFDPIVEAIPETVEIPFINPITEDDVVLDVDTKEYIDTLRVYKIVDADNFKHFGTTLVKYDRATALGLAIHLIETLSKTK